MQPLSGNQRPDLLTALMNMSLVLRLPCEMHLAISSSHDMSRCQKVPSPGLPPPGQERRQDFRRQDLVWRRSPAVCTSSFPTSCGRFRFAFRSSMLHCNVCWSKSFRFGFFISILMHESQGSRLSPMLRIMHPHGNTRLQRVRASGWWWNSGRTLIHAV